MELFFSNSNFNNLFESSSVKDFLVNSLVDSLFDSLMCLKISFRALKILKFSLSGLIPIDLNPSSFSNAFCISISQLICLSWDLLDQSPLQVYNHENKYQFHILKLCNEFVYSLSNAFFIESSIAFSVTFIMSCSLKPKMVPKFSLCFCFSNLFTPSLHCFTFLKLFH